MYFVAISKEGIPLGLYYYNSTTQDVYISNEIKEIFKIVRIKTTYAYNILNLC